VDSLLEKLAEALRKRGLLRITHPCEHCGRLTTVDLTKYGEFNRAVDEARQETERKGQG
jgi:hypothetical protein